MLQMKPRENNGLKWVLIIFALSSCSYAQSKFANCADPGPPEAYKIYVDEVRVPGSPASNAQIQQKLQSVHNFLVANLKVSAGENASVRDCGKRFPSDASDFDNLEFDGLDNLRVVLEVWGVLEDPARGSGAIGFALVPAHPLTPPAVYVVPSANLLNSLRQGKQMSGFAPLVLGIRHYQNKRYADAVPLLCGGAQQLEAVLSGQNAFGDAAFRTRQQELLKKVKEVTDIAIREARKTPGSPFALLSPASDGSFACPQ
jgi:hypothetical protein